MRLRQWIGGFTIVEMMIVVIVIGILATIGVVSYGEMQRTALNTARLKELKNWSELFELYKNKYGQYPGYGETDGGACLGTGFPTGSDGAQRCREKDPNPGYSYSEADAAALMDKFTAFTEIPVSEKRPAGAERKFVGPWAEFRYNEWRDFTINTAIDSTDPADCTRAGFVGTWTSPDGSTTCALVIPY